MIISGEKKEEYREFKPYWLSRFGFPVGNISNIVMEKTVLFINGYSINSSQIKCTCLISVRYGGLLKWGGESNKWYIVLSIRKIN